MKYALLFRENQPLVEVSADEVRQEKYDRNEEFVDLEYQYRVKFVKGARNNGGPYFRMYLSHEDYKRLESEGISREEIVSKMRRYDESSWHKRWKQNVSEFCEIEKRFKNNSTLNPEWKIADAYYSKTNTCIEFQHSYIANDFEDRNEFYSNLSINMIWLCDLPKANARRDEQGNIEILEDNSKGFFRISEKPENLRKYRVYIQVKSGQIYRVSELFRRESSDDKKSTIRYFVPEEEYTEEEFIYAIKANQIGFSLNNNDDEHNRTKETLQRKREFVEYDTAPKTLRELWRPDYYSMVVKNTEDDVEIYINHNGRGEMFRDYQSGRIMCKYVRYTSKNKYSNYHYSERQYPVNKFLEQRSIWILVKANKK